MVPLQGIYLMIAPYEAPDVLIFAHNPRGLMMCTLDPHINPGVQLGPQAPSWAPDHLSCPGTASLVSFFSTFSFFCSLGRLCLSLSYLCRDSFSFLLVWFDSFCFFIFDVFLVAHLLFVVRWMSSSLCLCCLFLSRSSLLVVLLFLRLRVYFSWWYSRFFDTHHVTRCRSLFLNI